ncbi:YceI family protein [Streptomyces sp. NPDC050264]|uniref:YceI family protein n=1 Tax=Streptomyces sp. NPDC050264 TaxID=3155038 RepID=UPI00341ED24A
MTVAVETGLWRLDADTSAVALRHKTMWGLVTVKGAFGVVSGEGEARSDGSVVGTLILDAASVDTKNAKRDEHLRSADFFDVANHPEITFAVRGVDSWQGDTVQLSGQLTVRGVSRPQSLTAHLADVRADALTATTEFTVDREEFGLGWNQMGMVRGLTTVTATLRFLRTAA